MWVTVDIATDGRTQFRAQLQRVEAIQCQIATDFNKDKQRAGVKKL